jgi:hypothetical protein
MNSPSSGFSGKNVVEMCSQASGIKSDEDIPHNMLTHGAFVIHAMDGHDNCKSALNEWSKTHPKNSKHLEQYLAILERYAYFYDD